MAKGSGKVIGFMVCGPGEADRYLERSLKEFKRLCDDALIVSNNADKKTTDLIDEYGYSWYADNREWGVHQPRIKTLLLENIGRNYNPDWVLPLDADEVYGDSFTRDELERLMDTSALAYYFYLVNLWDDEGRYKKSISFWNIRAFKYAPKWGLHFLKRNVHCGLAPPYAYRYGRYAPHIIKHFGLLKRSDRMKKVKRYQKYDANADKIGIGGWYEALSSQAKGSEFVETEVQKKVEEEVRRMNQNLNKKFTMPEEKVYVFLYDPKSGREFDVPKKQVDKYLKRGCEVISEVEIPGLDEPEAPVIEKPEAKAVGTFAKGMTCDAEGCDFAGISAGGLKRHKTMKHGKKKE
jgi:hypothetical protein